MVKKDFEGKDLAEVFESFDKRLSAIEAVEKYPTTSRPEFMSACMKDGKDMKECSELWEKVEKPKVEKAYPKPDGDSFKKATTGLIDKTGARTIPELKMKLQKMSGEEFLEEFEIASGQFPSTVIAKTLDYLRGQEGKEWAKRKTLYVAKLLGLEEAEDIKKITHILPGGEMIAFGSRATAENVTEAAAKRFLNWGREHQDQE